MHWRFEEPGRLSYVDEAGLVLRTVVECASPRLGTAQMHYVVSGVDYEGCEYPTALQALAAAEVSVGPHSHRTSTKHALAS
jgi:hypothetical protein